MFVRREHGFALLIVLWTLVLVAFIVVQGVGGEILALGLEIARQLG